MTITFDDGTQATGNLLIGAEGAHSPTREYLLGAQDAALLQSPIISNISVCKIGRSAALKLREMNPRYVITLHPKGFFTFMSRKSCSNLVVLPSPRSQYYLCSSRLLFHKPGGLDLDDYANMAL